MVAALKDEAAAPRSAWLSLLRALSSRVAWFVATLVGAVVFVQTLLATAPGDAIDTLQNSEEVRPILEAEWGLDQPLPLQVLSYLADLARGDLRTSITYRPGADVVDILAAPAFTSLGYLLATTFLTVLCALSVAWFTAGRRSPERWVIQAVSVLPVFVIAQLLVYGLNELIWSWVVRGSLATPPAWHPLPEPSTFRAALAIAILSVGSGALADAHQALENALVQIRASGYIEAAHGRGQPVWPHVLANLASPLTHVVGQRVAFFLGGLVILESVLQMNGIGNLMWRAAELRDYPLVLGITLVTAAVVCATRLLGDAVRIVIDPRLRESTR